MYKNGFNFSEGPLQKQGGSGAKLGSTLSKNSGTGKRITDRYVYLFDTMIVLCKDSGKERRLKERFHMRRVEVRDIPDAFGDLKNAFDVCPKDQPIFTLIAKSAEEKQQWMALLVMLQCRR